MALLYPSAAAAAMSTVSCLIYPRPPLTLQPPPTPDFPMTRRALLTCWAVAALSAGGCQRDPADYRIAVIPKGMTHEFWQSNHRGAVRAADDLLASEGLRGEVLWDGPFG